MAGKISLPRTCSLDLKISRLSREHRLSASMGGRRLRRAEVSTPCFARAFTHVGALIIGGLLVFLFLSRDSVLLARRGVAVSGGRKIGADSKEGHFEGGGKEPDLFRGEDSNGVWDVTASVTDGMPGMLGGAVEATVGIREAFEDDPNLPKYKPYDSHLWQIELDRRGNGASGDGRFQNQRLSGREIGLEDMGVANGVRRQEGTRGGLRNPSLEQVHELKRSKSSETVRVASQNALEIQRNPEPLVAETFVEEEGSVEARERLRRQKAFVMAGRKIGLDEGEGEDLGMKGWKGASEEALEQTIQPLPTAALLEISAERFGTEDTEVEGSGSTARHSKTYIAGSGWISKPKGEVPNNRLEARDEALGSLNGERLVGDVNTLSSELQLVGGVRVGGPDGTGTAGSGFLNYNKQDDVNGPPVKVSCRTQTSSKILGDDRLVGDVNVPNETETGSAALGSQHILGDVNGPQHNKSQTGSGFLKDDEPRLVSFVKEISQPIQVQKLRPAKIAFMFLANGSIHTDRIWDRFFKGGPGEDYYSVYIHR
jgi:hypothetical protein